MWSLIKERCVPDAPRDFVYPSSAIVLLVGVEMIPNVPTVKCYECKFLLKREPGEVDYPVLPDGIVLNALDGSLSGTPTSLFSQKTYTIIARNDVDDAEVTVAISVVNPSPDCFEPLFPSDRISFIRNRPFIYPVNETLASMHIVNGTLPLSTYLDVQNYIFYGTPSSVGDYPIQIEFQRELCPVNTTWLTLSIEDPSAECYGDTVYGSDRVVFPVDAFFVVPSVVRGEKYGVKRGALPSSLLLDETTGALYGKATQKGEFPVSIRVLSQFCEPRDYALTIVVEDSKSGWVWLVVGGVAVVVIVVVLVVVLCCCCKKRKSTMRVIARLDLYHCLF